MPKKERPSQTERVMRNGYRAEYSRGRYRIFDLAGHEVYKSSSAALLTSTIRALRRGFVAGRAYEVRRWTCVA